MWVNIESKNAEAAAKALDAAGLRDEAESIRREAALEEVRKGQSLDNS